MLTLKCLLILESQGLKTFQYPLLFADTSVYYVGEIRIMPRDQFSSLLESVGVTIVRPPEIGLLFLQ